jgi:hypothetical protein
MAATVLLAGGLVFLAPSLEVLGGQWAPAAPVARLLGIYVCLRSAAHLLIPLLAATGHPAADAALGLGWFALLAVAVAGATRLGISAVAAAQIGVAAIMLAAYVAVARRLVGISPAAIGAVLARLAVAMALAGACVLGLRSLGGVWAADATWPTLLLLGSAFTVAYGAAVCLLVPRVAADVRRLGAHLVPARGDGSSLAEHPP